MPFLISLKLVPNILQGIQKKNTPNHCKKMCLADVPLPATTINLWNHCKTALLKKTFQTKEMKFSDALSLPRMNILQPDASCKSKTQTKFIIWRAFFNWIYQLIQLVEMSTRACKRL